MKIAYIVPGPMSKGPLGATELRRREEILNSWAFPGTTVVVRDVASGPASIESAYEEALSFLNMAEEISAVVGVPAVNAAKAALKQAETLVSIGLSHSKTAFPTPAKMPAGTSYQAMRVA